MRVFPWVSQRSKQVIKDRKPQQIFSTIERFWAIFKNRSWRIIPITINIKTKTILEDSWPEMIGKAYVSVQGNINLLVFWLEKYLQNYNSRYKRSYDLRWWERHVGNIIPLGRRRQSVQRLYEGPLTWAGAVLPCKLIPALSCVLSCKTTPNDRESTKKCGFPVFCLPWILNLGGIWTFGRVGRSVWIGHLSPPFSKSISSILSKPRSPFQTTNSLSCHLSQTFLAPRM